MRTRLSRTDRRADILDHARRLIVERGLSATEMEHIRRACGISRGGLYHHFANKRAILDALVTDEVASLAAILDASDGSPIPVLLRAGSSHLGRDPGVLCGLHAEAERLDYLAALEQAFAARLGAVLATRLEGFVRPGTDAGHVAELFLAVTAHINRREILGRWSGAAAAGFAATALGALAPLLATPSDLDPIIAEMNRKAAKA